MAATPAPISHSGLSSVCACAAEIENIDRTAQRTRFFITLIACKLLRFVEIGALDLQQQIGTTDVGKEINRLARSSKFGLHFGLHHRQVIGMTQIDFKQHAPLRGIVTVSYTHL